jgi:hypothetical protein
MQTVTVQIKNSNGLRALNALADKKIIRIVEDAALNSPALPGSALGIRAFKEWISATENSPTIDLSTAKTAWLKKRKQLTRLSK